MLALPEMGHLTPLIRLAKFLQDKGHEVTFCTYLYHKQKMENMMFTTDLKCDAYFIDESNPVDREEMMSKAGMGMDFKQYQPKQKELLQ